LVPAESQWFNAKVAKYAYDPKKGAALLQAAGWVDHDNNPTTPRVYQGEPAAITWGDPLVLNYWAPNTPREAKAAEIFKQSAAACGIELKVKLWDDPKALYAPGPDGPIFGRKFDLAVVPMQMSYRPQCRLWMRDAIPGDGTLTIKDVPWLLKIFGKTHEDEKAFPLGWAGWNDTAYVNTNFDGYCRAANNSVPDDEGFGKDMTHLQAILARDFQKVGELSEFSCLKMHALALSANPGLLYWNGTTVQAMHLIRELRHSGLPVYFTIDAGPQIKVLCLPEDEVRVRDMLRSINGIERIVVNKPGSGVQILERQND
jgi:hypothetical protein